MTCFGRMTRMYWMVALLTVGSSAWSSSDAQQQAQKHVVVAIPEVLPELHGPGGQQVHGLATIVRFASAEKNDIIVLDSANATPATLAAAISLLRRIRAANPIPVHDGMAVLTTFAPSKLGAGVEEMLAARLKTLQTQPRLPTGIAGPGIGNIGRGRKIELKDAEINW